MTSTPGKIYRPKPLRPFEHTERPPSPGLLSADIPPSRTQSVMNLTSSTLLGIYSPTSHSSHDFDLPSQPSTPWGTGAETPRTLSISSNSPVRRKSYGPPPSQASTSAVVFGMALRSMLLFGLGMGYGLLVRHLHDDQKLAPFQVEGIIKPRGGWSYLVFWGVAGVALGSLLPWVDTLFSADDEESSYDQKNRNGEVTSPKSRVGGIIRGNSGDSLWSADWTPVVRSVGAFVGIAFAIRKVPWASSLQASLTLALVNPALWYLIDRSKPGFLLSTTISTTGTALLLASNPNILPSPASSISNGTMWEQGIGMGKGVGKEGVEGAVWILSVLFCSCVCFGNIGRRLALSGKRR